MPFMMFQKKKRPSGRKITSDSRPVTKSRTQDWSSEKFFDWSMQILYASPMNPTDWQKFIGRVSSMSKTLLPSFVFLCLLVSVIHASSKDKPISVELTPNWNRSRIEMLLSEIPNRKYQAISFLSRVAGTDFKSDRIVSVEIKNADGNWFAARRASPFVFIVPDEITSMRIIVEIPAPEDVFRRPFVSWMDGGNGAFVLADLVPIEFEGAVSVRLPGRDSHQIFPNIESGFVGIFGTARGGTRRNGIAIRRVGDWKISDDEIETVVKEVVADYSQRFGGLEGGEIELVLIRASEAPGKWTARTVGSTIIISSSGMPFETQEMQRLHEQMRHELFHLWIPNSLELKGDYATFYEGFALYQSLKSGVATGRIRFVDFLSTLSAALRISEKIDSRPAIGDQWRDDRESLYAAGIVSAFATDVSLISASGGRRSSDSFIREFITRYKGSREDARIVIREYFSRNADLNRIGIGDDLMLRRDSISDILLKAGLRRDGGSLDVVSNPSSGQKRVLKVLGYNAKAKLIQMPIR
jgi:hypothetical protein